MTKIAILGSAPSSVNKAPFGDQDWEIWCCSPPNFNLPRVDAWFELHDLDRKLKPAGNQPYVQTIMKHPRVYITQPDQRLPNGVLFPWKELVAEFGPYFFSSSIAWMMAFAIIHKPQEIGLWGVDMSAEGEYGYQRAGCHYFIHEAQNRGIKLTVPPQSDILMPHPLYAIREHWPMWQKMKMRRAELTEKLNTAKAAVEGATRDMDMLHGAIGDMQYMENTWLQPNWMEMSYDSVDPRTENTDED